MRVEELPSKDNYPIIDERITIVFFPDKQNPKNVQEVIKLLTAELVEALNEFFEKKGVSNCKLEIPFRPETLV